MAAKMEWLGESAVELAGGDGARVRVPFPDDWDAALLNVRALPPSPLLSSYLSEELVVGRKDTAIALCALSALFSLSLSLMRTRSSLSLSLSCLSASL